jgi:putative methyltransferase (TIGR04325 family)
MGVYQSWEDACANSRPYKTDIAKNSHTTTSILTLARQNSSLEFELNIVSLAILTIAVQHPGKMLNILDFGGGLGRLYFKTLPLLKMNNIANNWIVVDLPDVIDFAKSNIKIDNLKFYTNIPKK